MADRHLSSVRRPALLALCSAAFCLTIGFTWTEFPSLVPIGVLVVLVLTTAVMFVGAEVTILLRLARIEGYRGQVGSAIRGLSNRARIGYLLLLLLGNASLFFVFRASIGHVLTVNLAFIVSWLATRRLAARQTKRSSRYPDEQ
jgi:hypothetical protein